MLSEPELLPSPLEHLRQQLCLPFLCCPGHRFQVLLGQACRVVVTACEELILEVLRFRAIIQPEEQEVVGAAHTIVLAESRLRHLNLGRIPHVLAVLPDALIDLEVPQVGQCCDYALAEFLLVSEDLIDLLLSFDITSEIDTDQVWIISLQSAIQHLDYDGMTCAESIASEYLLAGVPKLLPAHLGDLLGCLALLQVFDLVIGEAE